MRWLTRASIRSQLGYRSIVAGIQTIVEICVDERVSLIQKSVFIYSTFHDLSLSKASYAFLIMCITAFAIYHVRNSIRYISYVEIHDCPRLVYIEIHYNS
jgi:hypothetical protein